MVSKSLTYKVQSKVCWTADNGQPFLILRYESQRWNRLGLSITRRGGKTRAVHFKRRVGSNLASQQSPARICGILHGMLLALPR